MIFDALTFFKQILQKFRRKSRGNRLFGQFSKKNMRLMPFVRFRLKVVVDFYILQFFVFQLIGDHIMWFLDKDLENNF